MHLTWVVKSLIFSSLEMCLLLKRFLILYFVVIIGFLCITSVLVSGCDLRYLHFFHNSLFLLFILMFYFSLLHMFISNLLVFGIGGISCSTWCIFALSGSIKLMLLSYLELIFILWISLLIIQSRADHKTQCVFYLVLQFDQVFVWWFLLGRK